MENKQTAVEWLVEQLETIIFYTDEAKENTIEQAKAMEKEQIKNAFDKGYSYYLFNGGGEQYYNKTYKQQDNAHLSAHTD